MDTNILHAVDTLYLQMFQQNLLVEIRRAHIMFRHRLRQSGFLSTAQELPPGFQKNYGEMSERLLPLIDALVGMESDLSSGSLSWQMQPDEWGPIEAVDPGDPEKTEEIIAWLDATEQDILNVLNNVGERLATLPPSIVSWSDCGFFSVHVELKRLPERPCYHCDEPIDIRSQPDFCADYFARKDKDIDKSLPNDPWPHYLLDELIPLTLLPLIEDLWIEMDAHADGPASWRSRDATHCDVPTGATYFSSDFSTPRIAA